MSATRYVLSPDDLARAVFLQNGRNGRIHLDFPTGPRSARDTFNFLLDLFLKGLVLLYGDPQGRLDISTLGAAQVAHAVDRMRHLGVETSVVVVPAPTTSVDTDRDAFEHAETMLVSAGADLASSAPGAPGTLNDLDFTIRSGDRIVKIQFRCVRV